MLTCLRLEGSKPKWSSLLVFISISSCLPLVQSVVLNSDSDSTNSWSNEQVAMVSSIAAASGWLFSLVPIDSAFYLWITNSIIGLLIFAVGVYHERLYGWVGLKLASLYSGERTGLGERTELSATSSRPAVCNHADTSSASSISSHEEEEKTRSSRPQSASFRHYYCISNEI